MYKTSTCFIKAQTPGISIPLLLELYKQELEFQEVSKIEDTINGMRFSIAPYKIFWFQKANKFSNFKSGQITIEEKAQEYMVTLTADLNRLLNKAGLTTAIVVVMMMIGGVFNGYAMFFGLFVFLAAVGIFYLQTALFFPLYFKGLRRRFERLLENEESAFFSN
jgi:hypothetical protein